jgi:hypothetical protein
MRVWWQSQAKGQDPQQCLLLMTEGIWNDTAPSRMQVYIEMGPIHYWV